MLFMGNSRRRRHDDMLDSSLFKMMAVGALVYMGAKALKNMMED